MTALLRLPPAWRGAIFLWAAALLGVLGRVAVSPLSSQSVVPIYLAAAERWAHGDDLYTLYYLRSEPDVYRYPPGFAACFVPFTWLPPRLAAIVWRVVCASVFLTGLGAWVRHALQLPTAQQGVVFALAAPLALPSLNNAQANLVVIGLLLHGATAAIRCRGVLAGACFAAAAAIKVYPAAVGLLVAAALPRRVLPGFVLALAGFAALPFVLAPDCAADHYRRFVEAEQADDRRHGDHQDPPRDLYWVLRTYFLAPSDAIYTGTVIAAAAAMAAAVVVTRYTAPLRSRLVVDSPLRAATAGERVCVVLAFDLGCVWMTVFGPATEPATYTLLAPTAAAAVVLAGSSRLRLALALAGYLLLAAPVVRDFFPNGRAFHALGPQPLGGLLLLAAVVLRATGESVSPTKPSHCSLTEASTGRVPSRRWSSL